MERRYLKRVFDQKYPEKSNLIGQPGYTIKNNIRKQRIYGK